MSERTANLNDVELDKLNHLAAVCPANPDSTLPTWLARVESLGAVDDARMVIPAPSVARHSSACPATRRYPL